jgi:ADP-ribosyl-[dinitrogen reductase] hydrolase
MRAVRLTTAQLDRACGAVLGSAVGDALGAGYEFGSATVGSGGPAMIGGGLGGFAPGEWTDDTSMAVAILEVAASGVDLRDESSLDRIASGFRAWFDTHPPDIGVQTRRVLADAGPEPTAAKLTAAAYDLHVRMGRTAGNGGLMRTSPVALAHLDDDAATAEAARRIGELTHFDPRSGEACTLWSLAIRHAILHAEFDIRSGLAQLDVESAAYWTERLDEAEVGPASRFTNNEWVVEALQAAWSAIVHTPVPHGAGDGDAGMPCAHLPAAPLHRDRHRSRHRHGRRDRRGAARGAMGRLRRSGALAADAARLPGNQRRTARRARDPGSPRGKPLGNGWPLTARVDYTAYTGRKALARQPFDDGVWLGDVDALEQLPGGRLRRHLPVSARTPAGAAGSRAHRVPAHRPG